MYTYKKSQFWSKEVEEKLGLGALREAFSELTMPSARSAAAGRSPALMGSLASSFQGAL